MLCWCLHSHALAIFYVFMKKRKKSLFPFQTQISDCSVCAGVKFWFSRLIFTMEINCACCVVTSVQNNYRRCSHFRILRNWDEKTRIWTLFFYVIFFINKKNFFTSISTKRSLATKNGERMTRMVVFVSVRYLKYWWCSKSGIVFKTFVVVQMRVVYNAYDLEQRIAWTSNVFRGNSFEHILPTYKYIKS